MIYQVNTDNNLKVSPEYAAKIEGMIKQDMEKFAEHIPRLEIYLSDQNADKKTDADKRCNIEVRLKGKPPIAVSDDADTYDKAVSGAASKLKSLLETKIGKARGY